MLDIEESSVSEESPCANSCSNHTAPSNLLQNKRKLDISLDERGLKRTKLTETLFIRARAGENVAFM